MLTDLEMEQHYSTLPSEELQVIKNEYTWAHKEVGVDTEKLIQSIDKVLGLRIEELPTSGETHKILFLCKCGQSRIVSTNIEESRIREYVFEQFNVPCSRCRDVNNYTWKIMPK